MTAVMTQKSPRERTVRSAALLFRERGVGGTGLREVVEHAGAPRGSLQYYFPGGKEQLLVEAMAWMAERAARPLHAALAAAAPPSPRAVVHGVLDRFRELLTITDYRGGCPIVAGVADASWDSPAVTDGARAAFATWLVAAAGRPRPRRRARGAGGAAGPAGGERGRGRAGAQPRPAGPHRARCGAIGAGPAPAGLDSAP